MDQIFDLHQILMPDNYEDKTITKKMWKKYAVANFNIIVGMVIGTQATAEQLKEIKETITKLSK